MTNIFPLERKKKQQTSVPKALPAPWVFIFSPDMLPGFFSLHPFDPKPQLLMQIDPEGSILEKIFYTFLQSISVCMAGSPSSQEELFSRLSSLMSKRVRHVLGLKKNERFWLLSVREFRDRTARGEFSSTFPDPDDIANWGEYWGRIQARVYNDINTGKKTLPVPIVLPTPRLE